MFYKPGEFAFIDRWKIEVPHYSALRTIGYGAVVVPLTLLWVVPFGVAVAAKALASALRGPTGESAAR